jgi:hypothetical protein
MSNIMSSEDWEDFSMTELEFEAFLEKLYGTNDCE